MFYNNNNNNNNNNNEDDDDENWNKTKIILRKHLYLLKTVPEDRPLNKEGVFTMLNECYMYYCCWSYYYLSYLSLSLEKLLQLSLSVLLLSQLFLSLLLLGKDLMYVPTTSPQLRNTR